MICERLRGGSILDCHCMVEGGGWLECPPPLRRPLPKLEGVLETLPKPIKPVTLGWGSGRDMITAAEFRAIAEAELRKVAGSDNQITTDLTFGGTTNADPTPPPAPMNVKFWRSPTKIAAEFVKPAPIRQIAPMLTGEFCREPGCGGFMVRTGSCMTCQSCGFNEGCG